jgi:hypothetical protein
MINDLSRMLFHERYIKIRVFKETSPEILIFLQEDIYKYESFIAVMVE